MTTRSIASTRPEPSEYAPYYVPYIAEVPDGDIRVTLHTQLHETLATLMRVDEARAMHRYAPGKWSIKEVVGHVTDSERVFALRALAFSRLERSKFPGFDQDEWVASASFDERRFEDLVADFAAVRRVTLLQLQGLGEERWLRRGVANDVEFSVRAIAWILAGHERHHMSVLRDRYL